MKLLLISLVLVLYSLNLFPQDNYLLKFIFIPHPRSESKDIQRVAPGIEEIDFNKYDVIMLGGDLTYYTSDKRSTLEYCDSLFDLGNPNTLWTFGNHDVQSGNRNLIKEFTARDSYYSFYRDGVTFIVLDTEESANGFDNTFIKGDQMLMIKNVCDSITQSKHLIILHHRLIWMINNDYLKDRLTDSIAASSRTMDTTNFYSEIYPLIQKVKNKGIPVKVLGGDKSKINIEYSPEDSITFYAVRLASDFHDSINNVLNMEYNILDKTLDCFFVPLNSIAKSDSIVSVNSISTERRILKIEQNHGLPGIFFRMISKDEGVGKLEIFSMNGQNCVSLYFKTNKPEEISIYKPGVYIARATFNGSVYSMKFSVN